MKEQSIIAKDMINILAVDAAEDNEAYQLKKRPKNTFAHQICLNNVQLFFKCESK